MENKVKVWLARDKDGSLWVHPNIPFRDGDMWFCDAPIIRVDSSSFPNIKWEDDKPTEAYISLAEPQEQPKQKKAIDWEQRRYEIAKEMLHVIYRQEVAVSEQRQGIMLKDTADFAVAFADMLINKLKEQDNGY